MKKILLLVSAFGLFTLYSSAQLVDEKNVTVTMDLQPVLQLNMTTPDQIDFTFDNIQKYNAGIIKYGATILKVSSSVSWDLYVVGTSQVGDSIWDQQLSYSGCGGTNAIDSLPLSLLELHQTEANAYPVTGVGIGSWVDYSTAFTTADAFTPGQNSIYASSSPYTAPALDQKYIQGGRGVAGSFAAPANGAAPGGSYLTALPGNSDFYFTIDYRIVPGLPAIFPNAGTNAAIPVLENLVARHGIGSYANPGVYTMNVKYVLLEDQ